MKLYSVGALGGIYMRLWRTQTGMNFYWYEIFATVHMLNRDEMRGAWFRDNMTCFVK